jgi:hypothetical protein
MMSPIQRTLAFYRARKLVVGELKRQGYRYTTYEASEIATLARDYLSRHEAECLTWAAQTIWNNPVLRKMAEREQARRSKLNTGAQNTKARTTGLSAVHMSCAKGGTR